MLIALDYSIHHPPNNAVPTPTILYLPRGPFPSKLTLPSEDPQIYSLALTSGLRIVRINYRLSTDGIHPFPKPIHDVLAGYDWVMKHLSYDAPTRDVSSPEARIPKRIGVYGEFIGGGLAAMLALTESHIGRSGIAAAAVANPIVDWTVPFPETVWEYDDRECDDDDEYGRRVTATESSLKAAGTDPRTAASNAQARLSTTTLVSLRKSLFPKPESYFDPFASPLLFFRTPGIDIPSDDPDLEVHRDRDPDPDTLSTHPDSTSQSPSPTILPSTSNPDSDEQSPPAKRHRAHRRFPPTASGLRIPHMRIAVGGQGEGREGNILRDQGVALAEVMRRSVILHERGLRAGLVERERERERGGWLEEDWEVGGRRRNAEARRAASVHEEDDKRSENADSDGGKATNGSEAGVPTPADTTSGHPQESRATARMEDHIKEFDRKFDGERRGESIPQLRVNGNYATSRDFDPLVDYDSNDSVDFEFDSDLDGDQSVRGGSRRGGDAQDGRPCGAPVDDDDSEFENDPWNAVCVVGLRVYSKDPALSVEIVQPKIDGDAEAPLDLDDPAAGATKNAKSPEGSVMGARTDA